MTYIANTKENFDKGLIIKLKNSMSVTAMFTMRLLGKNYIVASQFLMVRHSCNYGIVCVNINFISEGNVLAFKVLYYIGDVGIFPAKRVMLTHDGITWPMPIIVKKIKVLKTLCDELGLKNVHIYYTDNQDTQMVQKKNIYGEWEKCGCDKSYNYLDQPYWYLEQHIA